MIRTLSTVGNWRSRRSLGNFAKVWRVAGLHFLELQSGAHMETPFDANGVFFFQQKSVESAANCSFMKSYCGIAIFVVSAQIIVLVGDMCSCVFFLDSEVNVSSTFFGRTTLRNGPPRAFNTIGHLAYAFCM